jgi:hypothetical protein
MIGTYIIQYTRTIYLFCKKFYLLLVQQIGIDLYYFITLDDKGL